MSISTQLGKRLFRRIQHVFFFPPLIFLVCVALAAPATVTAQVSFGGGGASSGGTPGGNLVGEQKGPAITIELSTGGVSLKIHPKQKAAEKKQKSEEQKVEEVQELEKSDRARTFLIQADMGIDPKLVAKVRADPKGTLKKYRNVLRKAKRSRNLEQQKNAAVYLGNIYYLQGVFREAKGNYSDALKLYGAGNDLDGQALMTNNLGAVAAASGNYDQAVKYYGDALLKFKAADNTAGQAMALNNLAVLARLRGRFARAVSRLKEALDTGAKADEARVLKLENLGKINRSWGQYKQAAEYLTEALDLEQKQGDTRRQADVLVSLGEVYRAWGQDTRALETFKKALDIYKKSGKPPYHLNNLIGQVYLDKGELKQAERFIKAGKSYAGLGRLSLVKSDYKAAKKYYGKLQKSAQRNGRPRDLFAAYTGLGKAAEGRKDLKRAEQHYGKAVDLVEEIRSGLLLSERRNFFSVPIGGFLPSEPTKGLIRVRLKSGRADKTVFPSELTRAREFAARIAQRSDVGSVYVPKGVADKEEQLFNRLASLRKARAVVPRKKDPARFDTLTKEIRAAERNVKAFTKKVRNEHRGYAAVRFPRPVSLKEAAVRPGEHIVVFDVLGEGIGVKLIKGKRLLKSFFLEWNAEDLEKAVHLFRKPFEEVDLRAFDPDLGATLYKRLLSGVLTEVPKGTPVAIIPDGVLAILPFEALVTAGKATWKQGDWGDYPEGLTYLGDEYPINYRESITAITLVRTIGKTEKRGDRLLVVADPVFQMEDQRAQAAGRIRVASADKEFYPNLMAAIEDTSGGFFKFKRLPETRKLADNLGKLYAGRCEIVTGLKATKEDFLNNTVPKLDRYGWIVFATHGLFSNKIPGLTEPFLALTMVPPGTDGFLKMSDVMALKMNADIVALTACQTGLGKVLSGEGIMSMGRAFQYAGAGSVLMSLWSVAADSSVVLADSFFKNLLEGKGKSEALKLARSEVRKAGYEHPFFWAPFILVGEVN